MERRWEGEVIGYRCEWMAMNDGGAGVLWLAMSHLGRAGEAKLRYQFEIFLACV
jgi:hypothetical protein